MNSLVRVSYSLAKREFTRFIRQPQRVIGTVAQPLLFWLFLGAGFAGSFFATRQGFISPESFTFIESAVILAIVVLGGMGSQIGIVLAAVLLVGLPEWFRELQQYRMLAFGAAMVLIMLWKPSGLLAHREPTIRLGARS